MVIWMGKSKQRKHQKPLRGFLYMLCTFEDGSLTNFQELKMEKIIIRLLSVFSKIICHIRSAHQSDGCVLFYFGYLTLLFGYLGFCVSSSELCIMVWWFYVMPECHKPEKANQ